MTPRSPVPEGATALVDAVDVRLAPSRLATGLALARIRITGDRELPVVRIRAGRDSGFGEAPPLPSFTGMDAAATARGLRDARERLLGRSPPDALRSLHAAPVLAAPVRCALDVALHDLIARQRGVPIDRLLGPRRQATVTISRAIGFHEDEALVRLVREYRARGVRAFKVKVGRDLASDRAAVTTVRRTAGDECEVALDANESLDAEAAVALARACRPLNLAYFEQPVPRGDLDGLRAVREGGIRVMADESVFDAADVELLARAEAVDLVAIKLIKCGGLAPAMDIVRAGAACGLAVTVIDPLGSAISLHAGLAVAVTISAHPFAHGLSAGFDVVAPHSPHVRVEGGRLGPADAPGLGVAVHWTEEEEAA